MPRLTKQDEAFIEHLLIDGYKPHEIAAALLRDGRGSRSSIYVRTQRWHRTGSVYPLSTGGRPRVVPIEVVAYMVDIMAQRSTYWAEELQWLICEQFGQWYNVRTLYRVLHEKEFTTKVVQRQAAQRDPIARMAFEEELVTYLPAQLVYADETYASDKVAVRRRGWAPKGWIAKDVRHLHYNERFSILPAYSIDGYLDGTLIKEGSVIGAEFLDWLQVKIMPQMNPYPAPRSVLIMDNCRTHDRVLIRELCLNYHVIVLFLPPYSPDYNPIELTFRLLKHWIRKNWELMPEYGEANWKDKFIRFLHMAVDNWGAGVDHTKLFKKCKVRIPTVDNGG